MPGFSADERSRSHPDNIEMCQRISDRLTRNHQRFELEFPVRVKLRVGSASTEIEMVSKNVSIGGLLLRSAQPVPEHTAVTFILSVHGKESLRPVHLTGEGCIVRVESGEVKGTFVIAVKCVTLVTQLEQFLPVQ